MMGSISYGKLEISHAQQGRFLYDLPVATSKDCYFSDGDVVALVMRAGAGKVCKHCGQPSPSAVSRRQAQVLAQRLLDYWRDCCLITYSTVMDKYRRLP